MDINDILKKAIHDLERGGQLPDDEVAEKWPQVGRLSTEDVARLRSHRAVIAEKAREYRLLKKKLSFISAQMDILKDDFWNDLHKAHGLPPEGSFHIHDDGRIFMDPDKKD